MSNNALRQPLEMRAAFTLVELLVVVGIIAILASMLLPSLNRAKASGQQAVCINNTKQVGLAFSLYIEDNNDTFPGAAAKLPTLPVLEDWIYWNINDSRIKSAARRDPALAPIARYTGGWNEKLLRCPADKDVRERLKRPPAHIIFRYSYAANSHYINEENRGITSLFPGDEELDNLPFRAAWIQSPSEKFMIVEEHARWNSPDDGRWTPTTEKLIQAAHPIPFGPGESHLSNRHRNKGTVTLADGHVETLAPDEGNIPSRFDARL